MRLSRRQRGFTLTELGIVVAVIAIMMTVIMMGRGMMTSARIGNSVQLIHTIRDGARSYSMRTTGGVSYAGISIVELQNQQILPAAELSPFTPPLGVSIIALNPPLNDSVQIQVCTPTAVAATDLQSSLTAAGGSIGAVARVGNCVQVVTR